MAKTVREKRASIARQTLDIIEKGYYENSRGEKVDVKNSIIYSMNNSVLYSPEDGEEIKKRVRNSSSNAHHNAKKHKTNIEVKNKTTFKAARDLLDCGERDVLCLNFASAKNPGGGFMKGSGAQEESLARASALYPCISQMKKMYSVNKKLKSALYTDYMIYSPKVPVFRDCNEELLDEPCYVSFLTAPAVNAGAVYSKEKENIELIKPTMEKRIEKIIAISIFKGYENMILGAFGCGVFKNSPEDVAGYFSEILLNNEYYKNSFKNIIFAVLDKSKQEKTLNVFKEKLDH
ncbi:TIGR02452 family protein [Natranaerofaba carboxydovora]|uniref:TIGR02452 family protein n=1 Tax=Natranaerofaba carboxydovora TaxID=2742683 RepID=UPI001F13B93F|nr:TIGR02452 family protein [Natranaerofaba carboxydovora]UMZ74267.1 hypothetical protein ACONDI_01854 [Natranaerofaba carboxydovora]